ncbi:MAG: restriction endonuclease subunit R [Synechococcaceae cyanobacterium SM2_3_2]|nr:restriction endonuclease subunit R [Synechococcaceae cyanobacterium SM2_3_2]
MTTVQTLPANILTPGDVHELLGLSRGASLEFEEILDLDPLSDFETQELTNLQELYFSYLTDRTLNEGQVKFLFISPLLKLAGFLSGDIKITLEENIATINIEVEDEGLTIKGRMDLLAIKRSQNTSFWILVVETKVGSGATRLATPQLLTYAYKAIGSQDHVWALASNGEDFQFFSVQQGHPPTYHYLPKLWLLDRKSSQILLQVLKAIRAAI